MVTALSRIITVAELAVRAAKAAKALRTAGSNESAQVLETECSRLCKSIVQSAQRRRRAAARARSQSRSGGRFT